MSVLEVIGRTIAVILGGLTIATIIAFAAFGSWAMGDCDKRRGIWR